MGEAFTKDRKSSACCKVGAMVATERVKLWAKVKIAGMRCGEVFRTSDAAGIEVRCG